MKSVKERIEERRQLIAENRKLLNVAVAEKRHLTAAERLQFDDRDNRVQALSDEIDTAVADAPQRAPHGPAPGNMTGYDRWSDDLLNGSVGRQVRPQQPAWMMGDAAELSDLDLALCGWLRNGFGEPIPRAEFDAAGRLGYDPRSGGFVVKLPIHRPRVGLSFQGEGAGPLGGYTVPERFLMQLEQAMKAHGPMLRSSEIITTPDGRLMKWPTLDDTTADGEDLEENQQMTEDNVSFGQYQFGAHKISSKIIRASNELIRDSALALADELAKALGLRLGRGANRRLTTGNARIAGIVNDATVGVTAAGTTTFTADDLVKLQHSVDPAYRGTPSAAFMMHSDVLSFVRRLKDGNGEFLFEADNRPGMSGTLLGDNVLVNQHMSNAMTTGTIPVLYGDLSHYKVRIVNSVRFRSSEHAYWTYDQVGFVALLELDGALLAPSSVASLCPVRSLKLA